MATQVGAPARSQAAPADGDGAGRAEPRPGQGRLKRRVVKPRTVLVIAAAGVFMEFVDATIVNIAFPSIRQSFPTARLDELTWIFNAYSIVFAAFLVSGGRIADLLGRKKLFEVGIVVFTVGSVLCAIAPSAGFLIFSRAVQAGGGAIVVPAAIALVLQAFPPSQRAAGVAMWGAAASLAAMLGPPLGGALIAAWSWRAAFLINVPVGIVAILVARRVLVESRAPGRRRMPDLIGAALSALAIGSLVLGIVKGQAWGWTSARVIGLFVFAVVCGALVGWRSTWHRSPALDPRLLRIRTFSVASIATTVGAMGFYAYLLCHVLFLTFVWHYSAIEAGAALVPAAIVAAVVGVTAKTVANRFGFRALVVPGALIWALSQVYFIRRLGVHPDFLGRWIPGQMLQGAGAGLTLAPLGGAATISVPGDRYGGAAALITSVRQIGAALGIAIVLVIIGTPTLFNALTRFRDGWTFAAICLALTAVIALALGPAYPDPVEHEADEEDARRQRPRSVGRPLAGAHAPTPATSPAGSNRDPLADVPMFAGLEPDVISALAAQLETVKVPAGDYLFHAGDAPDALYIVSTGRLEVLLGEAERATASSLPAGAVVGELGVITRTPRSASVRARRDSELLRLDAGAVDRLMAEPGFAQSVAKVLGTQLQNSRMLEAGGSETTPVTIAILGLTSGLALPELAGQLDEALRTWGPAVRIDAPDRTAVGADALAAAARDVDRAEREGARVLLVAESSDPTQDWTRFCLRQADRVIAVVNGGELAAGAATEPLLQGCDVARAFGSDGWVAPAGLAELGYRAGYALRDPSARQADVEVMARRLCGRSLGIVLSGGGARALAHVGVVEELLAAGLAIDRFAGAGVGALIAAMLAAEMDVEEIDARCYEEFVRRSPFADYTLPRRSLIRGERIRRMLTRTFGDRTIESLPRDFYCASADLIGGELVIHREGSLVDALYAGLAMPGLMSPVAANGALLVEGGVLNGVPIEPMAAAAEGPVIAVDAAAGDRAQLASDSQPRDEEWHQSPGLKETLSRALTLGASLNAAQARRRAELTITPGDGGVGPLEFHQYDTLRASGRAAAISALEDPSAAALLGLGHEAAAPN